MPTVDSLVVSSARGNDESKGVLFDKRTDQMMIGCASNYVAVRLWPAEMNRFSKSIPKVSPVKLLFYAGGFPPIGGIEAFIRDLPWALATHGHSVCLLCWGPQATCWMRSHVTEKFGVSASVGDVARWNQRI
jgi:hypothetical protein